MARRLTPSELIARIPEANFSTADLPDESGLQWLPVLPFDGGKKLLVLVRADRWAWTAVRTGASHFYAFEQPSIIGALPILELDPAALAEDLIPVAATIGVSVEELSQSLPHSALVDCAFATRSDYWIERALLWVEQRDSPTEISAALQALVGDSQVRQDLRHRAQRLIAFGGSS